MNASADSASERMRLHALTVERRRRAALGEEHQAAVRERKRRNPRADDGRFFWEEVRDVLWAAGVAECNAGFRAPGIVSVRAESLLPREELRPDQECEILEAAERVLRSAGYRVGINWDREPPRLLCTTPRVEVDLFG